MNNIQCYSFDPKIDKIIESQKSIRRIGTSNCIYGGTCKALEQLLEINGPECVILLLCYNNKEFNVKSDDPILETDTQIGCITSTITEYSLNNDEPSNIMKNICCNKIGDLHFTETEVMHKTNSNYVISANAKNIVNSQNWEHVRTKSKSPISFNNMSSPRSLDNFSSPRGTNNYSSSRSPDNFSSPRGTNNYSSFRSLDNFSSPRETNNFSSPCGDRKHAKKVKATGIIYGTFHDMHNFIYKYSGNRPQKNRNEISKFHVIPITILIEFINNIEFNGHNKINIWTLLRINKWAQEDETVEINTKAANETVEINIKAANENIKINTKAACIK
jgi:hypothetical protein